MAGVLALYGTETGTAHDLAEQIWREGYRRYVGVRVCGFDDYNLNDLPLETLVVFVVSTTGQGEMPSNMRANWRRLLNSRIPTTWLQGARFACFGLGDTSYQKYNFAAKKLSRRLVQLGAKCAVETSFGDDQHELGPYSSFDSFLLQLWRVIAEKANFKEASEEPVRDYPSKFDVIYKNSDNPSGSHSSDHNSDDDHFAEVPCVCNNRVTAESHFQDTRLITFDSSSTGDRLAYQPGDVLMVQPRNLPSTIAIAVEALGYSEELLDRRFLLRSRSANVARPPTRLVPSTAPTTLRECLSRYFDLHATPRRSFFAALALHATHDAERERLGELADAFRLDEYLDYAQRPRRTTAEALRDFGATARSLTPAALFDVLPPLRPRAFSIASSPHAHPGRLQLLVARIEFKAKKMPELRRGLCSTFLAHLQAGDRVFVSVRAGTFRFAPHAPRLLIGPGTGIAPFRALIAEEDALAAADASATPNVASAMAQPPQKGAPQTLVFFGCRGADRDFYFAREWQCYAHSTLVTAFSRPSPDTSDARAYVQDKLLVHGAAVWTLLAVANSQICVAGRAKEMPDAVVAALKSIATQHGGVADADAFVADLEKRGRLQFETWD